MNLKLKLYTLAACFIFSIQVCAAAQHTTCPDLSTNNQTWQQQGWFNLAGAALPDNARFVEVLISKMAFAGTFHTVTCNYETPRHQHYPLVLLERVQKGNQGPWALVYRGGVQFDQCVSNLTSCFFYVF